MTFINPVSYSFFERWGFLLLLSKHPIKSLPKHIKRNLKLYIQAEKGR
jgi:hypothetical protein